MQTYKIVDRTGTVATVRATTEEWALASHWTAHGNPYGFTVDEAAAQARAVGLIAIAIHRQIHGGTVNA